MKKFERLIVNELIQLKRKFENTDFNDTIHYVKQVEANAEKVDEILNKPWKASNKYTSKNTYTHIGFLNIDDENKEVYGTHGYFIDGNDYKRICAKIQTDGYVETEYIHYEPDAAKKLIGDLLEKYNTENVMFYGEIKNAGLKAVSGSYDSYYKTALAEPCQCLNA